MLDDFVRKINKNLEAFFADADRRYRLGEVSDTLLRASQEFCLREGKRIRPLLFVLAYKGYCGAKAAPDKGLFASAAAIELLHDFMLIHDDVIDKSDLRRGKPTLHKIFDKKILLSDRVRIGDQLAIVAGDIVFALAIEAFLNIEEDRERKERALKKLVQTAAYTGAGEFLDVILGHRTIDQLKKKHVFLTYVLKTARYTFECPLVMGALLAGAGNQEIKNLSRLGLAAGQAFQIYDDFLDLFASEKTIGKPILSDLAESKKTLLVFETYAHLDKDEKTRFKKILEKKKKTVADLEEFREAVIASGSYDICLKKMNALQQEATDLCSGLRMKKPIKEALAALIRKLSPSRMPLDVRRP